MENSFIVFQAGAVHVFSSALSLCELGWRQVIQAAVWPIFVVVAPPVSDDSPCFEEILEPADAQAFLAQLAVKALHVAILRGLAGLRVHEADLALDIPREEVTAR